MDKPKMLLQANHLCKSFRKSGQQVQVLQGLNLQVRAGDMVGIVGKSGAGKSTLLHLLGSLDTPSSGEIWFDGKNLAAQQAAELAHFRNRCLGFVFQFHHLLGEFTALENVTMPALIAGLSKAKALQLAESILGKVGLAHRLHHYPKELSGGEQQRVALARALVLTPHLLLADELTGNLDEKTTQVIFDILLQFNAEYGLSMVLVTHNMALAQALPKQYSLQDGCLK